MIDQKKIISFVGTGGVGKTTLSMATAIAAAINGKKVAAITVDPSRRLNRALGLIKTEESRMPIRWSEFTGSLDIFSLEAEQTFLRFVEKEMSPKAVKTLSENKIFRQISKNLRETHNFAAVYRLFEINEKDEFDLIVVDTPPSQAALDFFEAPQKLNDFFSYDGFRKMSQPLRLKWLQKLTGDVVVPMIRKVAGDDFFDEVLAFFEGIGGLKNHVQEITERLLCEMKKEHTEFMFVTSPSLDKFHNGVALVEQLRKKDFKIEKAIINQAYSAGLDGLENSQHTILMKKSQFFSYFTNQKAEAFQLKEKMSRIGFRHSGLLPKIDFREFDKGEILKLSKTLNELW